MKLRSEYEIIRSNMMSRVPSPSLNEFLNELLRKEQSQLTQHVLKQQSSGNNLDVAYAAIAHYTPSVSHGPGGIVHHTITAAKGQTPARDLSKIQCFGCKSYGHYASQCKTKFCNYCKSNGHVINDCKRRLQNRTPRSYHVNTAGATTSSDSPSAPVMLSPPPASTTSHQITPEFIQQMIINAFSALGISDKVLGTVIAKGLKCGRQFPLIMPFYQNKPLSAFFCLSSQDVWRLWHKD